MKLEGPVSCLSFLRWGPLLSNYIAWEEALFLSRMRWKTSTLFLKTGGALSMFILGASSLESS